MPYGEKMPPELIEHLRTFKDKPVDPDKPLKHKEKKFLELLVIGEVPKWRAYDIAYPPRVRVNDGSTKYIEYCSRKANQLLKKANVKKRYEIMQEQIKQSLVDRGVWTKEKGIEKLIDRIEANENEQKRINETYEAQIDMLLLKIQETQSANEKEKLLNQVMKLRKEIRNNTVNNNAIIQAVTELNKMHGFNAQEITVKQNEEFEIDKKLSKMSIEELTALLNKKNE
jgi:uncharacterized protein (UPF0335 family)